MITVKSRAIIESCKVFLLASWIFFKHYFIWAVVNFVACTLPLLITFGIHELIDENMFLGVMSFSITLLISNLYLRGKACAASDQFGSFDLNK